MSRWTSLLRREKAAPSVEISPAAATRTVLPCSSAAAEAPLSWMPCMNHSTQQPRSKTCASTTSMPTPLAGLPGTATPEKVLSVQATRVEAPCAMTAARLWLEVQRCWRTTAPDSAVTALRQAWRVQPWRATQVPVPLATMPGKPVVKVQRRSVAAAPWAAYRVVQAKVQSMKVAEKVSSQQTRAPRPARGDVQFLVCGAAVT